MTQTLKLMHRGCTSSTTVQSETALSLLGESISQQNETSVNLSQQLHRAQLTMQELRNMMSVQFGSRQHMLEAATMNFGHLAWLTDQRGPLPEPPKAISDIERKTTRHHSPLLLLGDVQPSLKACRAFELSSSFPPEIYTVQQRVPPSMLAVVKSHEEISMAETRRNVYKVLFQRSPRQWRRIDVSINIRRGSRFWETMKLSPKGYGTTDALSLIGAASLPHSLLDHIQKFLLDVNDLKDDSQVGLSISSHGTTENFYYSSQMHSAVSMMSLEILTFLDDLGCPRLREDQITQVAAIKLPYRFISCYQGSLVCETKFCRAIPGCEYLHTIQVLRCMDSIPGFTKFVGIVTDKSGAHLKGFLVELPRSKWSYWTDALTDSEPVPWERRGKWAKQLVEVVRQIHSKGLVAGTLGTSRASILIDQNDNLQLWRFTNKLLAGFGMGVYYPPEFLYLRSFSTATSEAECPNVTSKTDIFQLGLLLWYLAGGYPKAHLSPWCIQGNCGGQQSSGCTNPDHIDPVAFPQLPEEIPQYYRAMIDQCRARNPFERPAAWRLLELFPSNGHIGYPETDRTVPSSVHGDFAATRANLAIYCDFCRKLVGSSFYHCNICSTSDFDVCEWCFEHGLHCLEQDHLLVNLNLMTVRSPPVYWKASGGSILP